MPVELGALQVLGERIDVEIRVEDAGPVPGHDSPQRVRIIDATLDCLARHGTARRPRLTTSPAERGCRGPRCTGPSPAAGTRCCRPWWTRRWPGCSRPSVCGWARPTISPTHWSPASSKRPHGSAATPPSTTWCEHEPEVVLGHLAFDESDRLLATASHFTAPFLARWMSPMRGRAGRRVGGPDRPLLRHRSVAAVDISDPRRARHLVDTFMLPGIRALHGVAEPRPSISPRSP